MNPEIFWILVEIQGYKGKEGSAYTFKDFGILVEIQGYKSVSD